jgi:DUF4097 and DUF4098 domain-containing protein YvlB
MTRQTSAATTIEHIIGPTGRLNVKLADWDVELVAASDDIVRVRDTNGGGLPADLEVERGTDSLSIRQPSRFPGIGFSLDERGEGRRLTIDVPARANVTVQSASGDVEGNGLRGEQHIRTASGDIHLGAVGGDLETETVSGDISIEVEGSIGLAVRTVSGDVSVDGGHVERVRLTTTSGDVRLTSELGPGPHAIVTVSGDAMLFSNRGLRITAVTVAGDLRSDLPHTSQGGPGRRSVVVGDGAAELQFRSVSGDLLIRDPASSGDRTFPVPRMPPAAPPPPMPPAFVAGETQALDEPAEPDEADEAEASRLEILRALESGDIDVAEATDRLARLDGDRK